MVVGVIKVGGHNYYNTTLAHHDHRLRSYRGIERLYPTHLLNFMRRITLDVDKC